MNRPYFINVDVELTSRESLLAVENELAGDVSVMESGQVGAAFHFNFECSLPSESTGGLQTILETVIILLEGLSDDAKQVLRCCKAHKGKSSTKTYLKFKKSLQTGTILFSLNPRLERVV